LAKHSHHAQSRAIHQLLEKWGHETRQPFPAELAQSVHTVLNDLDGTLTMNGRLLPTAKEAMARVQHVG